MKGEEVFDPRGEVPGRRSPSHYLPQLGLASTPTWVMTSSWKFGVRRMLLPALSCRAMSGMPAPEGALRGGLLSSDQCSISSRRGATGMRKPVAWASLIGGEREGREWVCEGGRE